MKNVVLFAVVAVVVLAGCDGGGKAGAGNYKLKVSVNPANGGSISMDPNMESYNEWMDVKVTAAAAKGYIFDGWSGDATDKSKSVTIKMSGNRKKKLTANFKVLTPTFTDSRDGKTYKRVVIDEQVWMAENLNYEAEGSKCYENNSENCVRYGRLYNWSAAKSACPAGFHLPSDKEWTTLTDYVGGLATAGKKLKSQSGWNNSGDGTNDVEFSALPGGFVFGKLGFFSVGEVGSWWSATEDNDDDDDAWYRSLSYEEESVDRDSDDKTYLFSVRCVQDASNTETAQNAVPAQPNNTGTTQSAAPVQQNNTGSAQSATPAQQSNTGTAQNTVPAQDNNNDITAYVQNGMKYLESGDNNRRPADYDLAVAEFDKAIQLSQNNAEAYYGRGRAYLRKGDNSRAVADYSQAIRLNPKDAISYSNRGRAYARMNDYDNAVSDFESALRIDPNNAAIKQNLEKARRREKGL
jgi:uncharacterized protein (TIGR02145 family)/uncharacterized repeat protein (TIGR02543 family)